MRPEPVPAHRFTQSALHRAMSAAVLAIGVPDAVAMTAHALLRYIPSDAPEPVSPARVQDLADARGCDPRTIRNHIRRLIALGLAVDRTLAGGHRVIRRRASKIVALYGIDFTPLLVRREELQAEATRIRAEQDEKVRIRAAISALRRRFRLLASGAPLEVLERFAALPHRYAHLSLAELVAVHKMLLTLLATIAPIDVAEPASPEDPPRPRSSDRPEKYRRPNFLEEIDSLFRPLEGALPDAWHAELARGGQRNWSGFIATARAQSLALGIPSAAWDATVAGIGRRGAALLMLAAEAPRIRDPAAWMTTMARRAGEGPIDLSTNLYHLTT